MQHVSRKAGADFVLEGSNASAEEADEGTEEATESGVDLVLNHRLVETGFGKKADYMNYLKYLKKYPPKTTTKILIMNHQKRSRNYPPKPMTRILTTG